MAFLRLCQTARPGVSIGSVTSSDDAAKGTTTAAAAAGSTANNNSLSKGSSSNSSSSSRARSTNSTNTCGACKLDVGRHPCFCCRACGKLFHGRCVGYDRVKRHFPPPDWICPRCPSGERGPDDTHLHESLRGKGGAAPSQPRGNQPWCPNCLGDNRLPGEKTMGSDSKRCPGCGLHTHARCRRTRPEASPGAAGAATADGSWACNECKRREEGVVVGGDDPVWLRLKAARLDGGFKVSSSSLLQPSSTAAAAARGSPSRVVMQAFSSLGSATAAAAAAAAAAFRPAPRSPHSPAMLEAAAEAEPAASPPASSSSSAAAAAAAAASAPAATTTGDAAEDGDGDRKGNSGDEDVSHPACYSVPGLEVAPRLPSQSNSLAERGDIPRAQTCKASTSG